MSTPRIDCPGCHRMNAHDNIFCVNCRRKLTFGPRPTAPAVATPIALPTKRAWWQKLTG